MSDPDPLVLFGDPEAPDRPTGVPTNPAAAAPPRPLRVFPPGARGPVPPPACDRCGDPVDTLHCDGEAPLCGGCMRRIAAGKVAAADAVPVRLVRPRLRIETK